ncbi:MAG: alpha/beta fold hydrolase [Acidobacteriota bacterium]|nr:alpha/beta fold hydrolase [Acidobacteriota bacterium]
MKFFNVAFSLLLFFSGVSCAQEQQFAALGDFRLESGETIRDCRIGYRTYGRLNADKSNAVLITTWAGGNTEQLKYWIAPGGLIDPAKYFVIAIDALGNGVSSSPSNSKLQPRMRFPRFTLRDTVNTQHELLTKVLKINHLRAIMGVSMGGMQTFQWLVSYPDFADKAIPIVASPQLAPYDLVHWQTQIDAIMNDAGWMGGDYAKNPARGVNYGFGVILLTTPENFNAKTTRQKALEEIAKAKAETAGFDANDKIRQTQAMMTLDITEKFGGSWERTAQAIKAKVFVIVARYDYTVTPQPALKLAKLLNAKTLVLEGDCGHLAPSCESQKVNPLIAEFLAAQ